MSLTHCPRNASLSIADSSGAAGARSRDRLRRTGQIERRRDAERSSRRCRVHRPIALVYAKASARSGALSRASQSALVMCARHGAGSLNRLPYPPRLPRSSENAVARGTTRRGTHDRLLAVADDENRRLQRNPARALAFAPRLHQVLTATARRRPEPVDEQVVVARFEQKAAARESRPSATRSARAMRREIDDRVLLERQAVRVR
jgi:hypothetical protein